MTEEEFSLSICIPFCDKDAHFIPELLNSIYEKVNIKDFEILLFDNRDNKVENFDFSDSHIRYFDMGGNKYPFKVRIESFLKSSKKFIWQVDADDSIEELNFSDVEKIDYSENTIIRFLYKQFEELLFEWRITNLFIPNSNKLKLFLIKNKFLNLSKEKIYYGDDALILDALLKNFNFININKHLYTVNRTLSGGAYSKPFRTIEDYISLLEGSEYELKKTFSYDSKEIARIMHVNFFQEMSLHNEIEQQILFKILNEKSKISFPQLILAVKYANEYGYEISPTLLSSAERASLDCEHE